MTKRMYMTKQLVDDLAADSGFHIEVLNALLRFMDNDWGEIEGLEKSNNTVAKKKGGEVIGAYTTSRGVIIVHMDDIYSDDAITKVMYEKEYME